LIKYNTDESLVTETLVKGLVKYNTDESLVTETLVTGLIKYNTDKILVTEQVFNMSCGRVVYRVEKSKRLSSVLYFIKPVAKVSVTRLLSVLYLKSL
jgi:hypothetical protein